MRIGMLWFDNDPKKPLATKIQNALEYYQNKYGKTPTLVVIHPSMLQSGEMPVEVQTNRSVRPNHFWVGMKDET